MNLCSSKKWSPQRRKCQQGKWMIKIEALRTVWLYKQGWLLFLPHSITDVTSLFASLIDFLCLLSVSVMPVSVCKARPQGQSCLTFAETTARSLHVEHFRLKRGISCALCKLIVWGRFSLLFKTASDMVSFNMQGTALTYWRLIPRRPFTISICIFPTSSKSDFTCSGFKS